MRRKKRLGLYNALVTLPDRLYPFRAKVGGQWVRGVRAYNATLLRYERTHGMGHYGYGLEAYRQLFHLTGSILFLVVAAYVSQAYFGSTKALYAFLAVAVLFISYQEFYLHRRLYRQLWKKGVLDWLAWCVPMGIFVFTHLR
ncbi:MAG TPA: hypothetical protein VMV50_00755 [Candidatus Paceibacterota bacterium]|nr:hypothetical protein [Candidatus Paceibacterota bacterium]